MAPVSRLLAIREASAAGPARVRERALRTRRCPSLGLTASMTTAYGLVRGTGTRVRSVATPRRARGPIPTGSRPDRHRASWCQSGTTRAQPELSALSAFGSIGPVPLRARGRDPRPDPEIAGISRPRRRGAGQRSESISAGGARSPRLRGPGGTRASTDLPGDRGAIASGGESSKSIRPVAP